MKRSKEQILERILVVCKEPVNVTKIVYQCNLNFYTVRIFLKHLTDAGLLDVYGAYPISYKTTQVGIEALKHISAFRSLLMPISSCSKKEIAVHEDL